MRRTLIAFCIDKIGKMLPAFMRKWWTEMWFIPTLIALFFFAAKLIRWIDPTAGVYDAGILQRYFLAAVGVFVGCLVAYMAIRMYYREMWKHAESEEFERDWNMLDQRHRIWMHIVLFLGLLFAFVGLASAQDKSDCILATAKSQIGVHELTGNNDGKEVEAYLASVHLKKGNPWCAAFIAWTYDKCGVKHPVSGYCPNWFQDKTKIVYKRSAANWPDTKQFIRSLRGATFGIYFASKKRVAHVGIVEKVEGDYLLTIEGNTNEAGSREGDGVYRKRRLKNQVYTIAIYHQIHCTQSKSG